MTGRRISATIVDLITSKRDILTEFVAKTGCRISATIVDLITSKRDILWNLGSQLDAEFLQPSLI